MTFDQVYIDIDNHNAGKHGEPVRGCIPCFAQLRRELDLNRTAVDSLRKTNHRNLCGCEEGRGSGVFGCGLNCPCTCHELRAELEQVKRERDDTSLCRERLRDEKHEALAALRTCQAVIAAGHPPDCGARNGTKHETWCPHVAVLAQADEVLNGK